MKNGQYNKRDVACFADTMAVTEKHLPAPFLESFYYDSFEFQGTPLFDLRGIQQQADEFFSVYMPASGELRLRFLAPSYRLDTNSILLDHCKNCSEDNSIPACYDCTNREKHIVSCPARKKKRCSFQCEFVHQFHGFLSLQNDYACPLDKQKCDPASYCVQKCRYDPEGQSHGDEHCITVHDLRFHGHASIVQIFFEDHRCSPKKELLKNLPGIYKRSGSNQVRYSIRLAKCVKTALVGGVPRNYISEAAAIPYDSVRSWLRREKETLEREVRKARSSFSFMRSGDYNIYHSTPIKIGDQENIICTQPEDNGTFLTGVYSAEEWNAIEELFQGNVKAPEENCFLRKISNHIEECFLYHDVLLHYLATISYIEPAITTYVVLRILMKYYQWEIVTYPDIPEEYRDFYDNCWNLFQQEFDLDSRNKTGAWLIDLISVFSPDTAESRPEEVYQRLGDWYKKVNMLMEDTAFYPSHAQYRDGEDQIRNVFTEQSYRVSVRQEDIPVLLQYYNPEMIPHTGLPDDPPYEFYFNEEGDFDFTYGYQVMPGPTLTAVSYMLKEGLLEEERTKTEPICAWL